MRFRLLTPALVLIASSAFAQKGIDPFDYHCCDITSLQVKLVQKEVGITEAQRTRMNEQATWHQQQLLELDRSVKAKKQDPASPSIQSRIGELFAQLKGRILPILSAKQITRVREISIQQVGDAALCDPVIAKRVGMSDDQLKKMIVLYREGARKFRALEESESAKVLAPYRARKPKDAAEAERLNREVTDKLRAAGLKAKPKLDAVRSEYRKSMRGILTANQLAAFLSLEGKPFTTR